MSILGCVFSLITICISAVSYTHLDVYKRQVFDGRPVAGSVFGENDRARAGGYQVAERP